MTQEEKARAYDEALKKAREYYNSPRTCINIDALQEIFPQLEESEDEKIREEMIRYFTEMKEGGSAALPYDDCIAYLERRKETGVQWLKSDNVKNPDKPYIDKAGMFYTTDGRMCHASEIEKQKEQKVSVDDFKAKDWYVSKVDGKIHNIYYSVDKVKPKFKVGDKIIEKDFDECGRGTIIDIKDGKYIFDDGGFICIEEQGLWKLVEQKPAEWSDTNELVFKDICKHLEVEGYGGWVLLLNALRNGEFQPKQEWSEEDEKRISQIERIVKNAGCTKMLQEKIHNWFESLRPQSHWKPSEEQMEAFKKYIEEFQARAEAAVGGWNNFDVMIQLYEQLKKL